MNAGTDGRPDTGTSAKTKEFAALARTQVEVLRTRKLNIVLHSTSFATTAVEFENVMKGGAAGLDGQGLEPDE